LKDRWGLTFWGRHSPSISFQLQFRDLRVLNVGNVPLYVVVDQIHLQTVSLSRNPPPGMIDSGLSNAKYILQ